MTLCALFASKEIRLLLRFFFAFTTSLIWFWGQFSHQVVPTPLPIAVPFKVFEVQKVVDPVLFLKLYIESVLTQGHYANM
jgi:hypothetical protein